MLDTLGGSAPDVAVTQTGYIVALVDVSSVTTALLHDVALVADVAVDALPAKVVAVIICAPAFQSADSPTVPSDLT